MSLEKISPSTLAVTHIFDGEEVVTGGADGQVWVATFADREMAATFVQYLKDCFFHVKGQRQPLGKNEHLPQEKSK